MPRRLTPASSLRTLSREAKRWLKALHAGNVDARARLELAYPAAPPDPVLRDVQHALARECGLESWKALRAALDRWDDGEPAASGWRVRTNEEYERLANDFVAAFNERDEAALGRLNEQYGRTFSFDDLWAEVWRRVYAFRQRAFRSSGNQILQRDEARGVIAQDHGFGSWRALLEAAAKGAERVPAYAIDAKDRSIAPRRQLRDAEWDELIAAARAGGATTLDAGGVALGRQGGRRLTSRGYPLGIHRCRVSFRDAVGGRRGRTGFGTGDCAGDGPRDEPSGLPTAPPRFG